MNTAWEDPWRPSWRTTTSCLRLETKQQKKSQLYWRLRDSLPLPQAYLPIFVSTNILFYEFPSEESDIVLFPICYQGFTPLNLFLCPPLHLEFPVHALFYQGLHTLIFKDSVQIL